MTTTVPPVKEVKFLLKDDPVVYHRQEQTTLKEEVSDEEDWTVQDVLEQVVIQMPIQIHHPYYIDYSQRISIQKIAIEWESMFSRSVMTEDNVRDPIHMYLNIFLTCIKNKTKGRKRNNSYPNLCKMLNVNVHWFLDVLNAIKKTYPDIDSVFDEKFTEYDMSPESSFYFLSPDMYKTVSSQVRQKEPCASLIYNKVVTDDGYVDIHNPLWKNMFPEYDISEDSVLLSYQTKTNIMYDDITSSSVSISLWMSFS